MKVLLTHTYFLHFDPKQLKSGTAYPPLATLYAASFLRENNFEVKVTDLQFASSTGELKKHLDQFRPEVLVIYDDGFNYLSKMCLSNMREAAFEMIEMATRQNIPVIVSGSDATDHAGLYLSKGAQYIVVGEAEHTLLDLLQNFKSKEITKNIPGLILKEGGDIRRTGARAVSKNLDEFPLPAWDLIDLSPYKKIWKEKHGYFSINLVTTRGCPYKCNWCAKPIYGNRYNSHSPQYVVRMINHLRSQTEFDHIWFADDIFGLKPGWLKEFSDLLEKEKINISYKIQSRADLLLEEENIKFLEKTGCETVWMGAESGSQKILDAMDKGITTVQIREAVRSLRKHGIKAALFLQFGYLDENMQDIRQTIDLLKELSPDDIGVSVSYPLPGTKFHEKVKGQLKHKSNWTDSDDLHLMFQNTYSPEFYKHLHRYVHHTFRAGQAKHYLKQLNFSQYRRMALWPWYKFQSNKEKNQLMKLEPIANGIL